MVNKCLDKPESFDKKSDLTLTLFSLFLSEAGNITSFGDSLMPGRQRLHQISITSSKAGQSFQDSECLSSPPTFNYSFFPHKLWRIETEWLPTISKNICGHMYEAKFDDKNSDSKFSVASRNGENRIRSFTPNLFVQKREN